MQIRYLVWLASILIFAGCGKSGPEVAPVSGRVTVDGQPMENVDVVFQPTDSRSPSYGRTDKAGHYTLGYKRGVEGALVGTHGVGISISRELVPNPPHIKNSERRVEVKPGNNEFNFDETSEAKKADAR